MPQTNYSAVNDLPQISMSIGIYTHAMLSQFSHAFPPVSVVSYVPAIAPVHLSIRYYSQLILRRFAGMKTFTGAFFLFIGRSAGGLTRGALCAVPPNSSAKLPLLEFDSAGDGADIGEAARSGTVGVAFDIGRGAGLGTGLLPGAV